MECNCEWVTIRLKRDCCRLQLVHVVLFWRRSLRRLICSILVPAVRTFFVMAVWCRSLGTIFTGNTWNTTRAALLTTVITRTAATHLRLASSNARGESFASTDRWMLLSIPVVRRRALMTETSGSCPDQARLKLGHNMGHDL